MKSALFTIIVIASLITANYGSKCNLQQIKGKDGKMISNKPICIYHPYKGPVGKIIADYEPSKISKVVYSQGKAKVQNMALLASLIPSAGSYLSVALQLSAQMLFESDQSVINRVITEISNQINSLKIYTDAKIQKLELTQLTQHLTGLLAAARTCADYDKPDQIKDLERCLISLNTRVVGLVGRFLPRDSSVISYDLILPLFRQYADLQLTVTQDLLRIAMRLRKHSSIKDYVKRLYNQAKQFYYYGKTGATRVIDSHIRFQSLECKSYEKRTFSISNLFSKSRDYHAKCKRTIYRSAFCEMEIFVPKSNADKTGKFLAQMNALACLKAYGSPIQKQIEKDLQKYWKLEILNVAEQWLKISTEAKKIMSSLGI